MSPSRYIVGIDLGTTNSALAYVAPGESAAGIHMLSVPQLASEGNVAEHPELPSFLYLAGEHDVAPGSLALPWEADQRVAVGEFARLQGTRVPGRLVSSAKSWLCHGGVDREAAILPWAAAEDVDKISPVDASARYLAHLRNAWRQRFPSAPLEEQDVILTVPASFDEVARELTVTAAERAGLPDVVLLEEPQAAFYAWIHEHEHTWQDELTKRRLVVVIDIGGGTTDFSLVAVQRAAGRVDLDRRAVGDHLLLGGDNIDVALARLVEPRLGEKLDAARWHLLTNLCRAAKERLLGENPPESLPVRLPGRGSALIGGARAATLTRAEVEELTLDGFFPRVDSGALPRHETDPAMQEWGLPFATEREVSRHLAAFLRQHAAAGDATARPDTVLFNGGAVKPRIIRDRLTALLRNWHDGAAPAVLDTPDLEGAVARGATYYGLVRRGRGVRIGGGSARAYYLGVAGAHSTHERVSVLCVAQRGMHEGEEVTVTEKEFAVTANRPVSFPLYSSSTRLGDRSGTIIEAPRDTLTELPPIRTVLRFGRKMASTRIPVHVIARLSEVGTLAIWCRSLQSDHRWRLEFALRDQLPAAEEEAAQRTGASGEVAFGAERVENAVRALAEVFPAAGTPDGDPVTLVRLLEEHLATGKDAWPLDGIRRLWDALWEGRAACAASEAHEARWYNLAGFLLRPGFGHDMDPWRIEQLWKLITRGPRFARAVQCRVEWWNMWKRVAGGLSRPQQMELYNRTAPHLLPRLKSRARRGKDRPGPQEVREYWQLLASCERLAAKTKAELGEVLLKLVVHGKATDAQVWALGRLGARAPFSGPINCVVDRNTVSGWVEGLLAKTWRRPDTTRFAVVQLARRVGDRTRDLDEDLCTRLAERLRTLPGGARAARLVTEVVPLERREQTRIFDESLPVGLHMDDVGEAERR